MINLSNQKQIHQLAWGGALGLLLIMLFLLPNITEYSMRNDEVITVRAALAFDLSDGYTADFLRWEIDSPHPPLYHILLNTWVQLAGQTDFALRTLTLFTTLLTAAFVYRLTVDITTQVVAGFAAALIFGSMGFVVYYTHQAHNYSLLMFTVMAAIVFCWRFWQASKRSLVLDLGVLLMTLLSIGTHYFAIYAIAALNVYALLVASMSHDWRNLGRWLFLQGLVALLYLPWLPVVAYTFVFKGAADPINNPTSLATLWETTQILLSEQALLYFGLLVVGMAAAVRNRRDDARFWDGVKLLVFFIVGSLVFALLVNIQLRTFVDRRVIYMLPALAILVATMLDAVPFRWRGGGGLVTVLIVVNIGVGWSPRLMGNWHYRHGVESLAELVDPDDVVYLQFPPPFHDHIINYYAERILPPTVKTYIEPETDIIYPYNMGLLMDDVWLDDHFWVMRATEDESDWLAQIPLGRFALAESIDVYWFTLDRYAVVHNDREPVGDVIVPPDAPQLPVLFGNNQEGFIALNDYRLDALRAAPGETITVYPDWEALQTPGEDFAVFVHLLDVDGELYGVGDANPQHLSHAAPTSQWVPGQPIRDAYMVTVNEDVIPGDYTLAIGFYSRNRPLRLPVTLGDGSTSGTMLPIATISIVGKTAWRGAIDQNPSATWSRQG